MTDDDRRFLDKLRADASGGIVQVFEATPEGVEKAEAFQQAQAGEPEDWPDRAIFECAFPLDETGAARAAIRGVIGTAFWPSLAAEGFLFNSPFGTGWMPFRTDSGEQFTAWTQEMVNEMLPLLEAIEVRNRSLGLLPPAELNTAVGAAAVPTTAPRRRPKLEVPGAVPYYTFEEGRALQRAVADARSGENWEGIEGELALRHAIPGEMLQIKYSPSARLLEFRRWMAKTGGEDTNELLREELRHLDFDARLLFSSCLSLVIERGGFSASLDELIAFLGWTPRSTAEREKDRLTIWACLLNFDSMRVVGLRRGSYKDPDDKKRIRDLSCNDDLLHIAGTLEDAPPRMDGLPYGVTLQAGPWIEEMRGDKSILSYLGNVRTLAEIPRKKLGGRLAAKIGVFLLQTWREKAAHDETQILHPGDENQLSVKFAAITRQKLLTCYGNEDAREIEVILASNNPGHARKYWDEAIKHLKDKGIIGYYAEESSNLVAGYKWQEEWYKKQLLDIRPSPAIALQVAEINNAGKKAEAKRKKAAVTAARQKTKAVENN